MQKEELITANLPLYNPTIDKLNKKSFLQTTSFLLLLFFVLGILGMIMVFYGTSKYGVGLSPDSVAYISTARNLIGGRGFHLFTNEPFIQWPPLYPLLLAALALLDINPLVGARLLNIGAFGLIIFFSGWLLLKTVKAKSLILWAVLSVLFSAPLLKVSVMAWTEPVYILLSVLFFLVFSSFLRKEAHMLVFCAAIAALVCMQRYVGVILTGTGALSILLFVQNTPISRRIRNAAIFLWLALIPLNVWLCYNFFATGTIAGHRAPAYWGISKHLSDTVTVLNTWFIPYSFPIPLSPLIFIMCLVAVLFISKRHWQSFHATNARSDIIIKLLIIYIGLYVAFIVAISSSMANEPIGNRLLSPIFPFVVMVVCICINQLYELIKNKGGRGIFLKFIINSLLFLWLFYPIYTAFNFIRICRQEGAGEDFYGKSYYGKGVWQESPLVHWLKMNPLQGVIYSNEPYALYSLTHTMAQYAPRLNEPVGRFGATLPTDKNCFLVWFKDRFEDKERFFMAKDQLYSIEQLRQLFQIEVAAEFTDGSIYRFGKLKLTP